MSAWLTAIAAGLIMYVLRAAVPLLAGRRELPERTVNMTSLVAPAVIAALLAGSLAASPVLADLLPRLVVLGVGFAVAARTQSVPLTIGAGLGTHLLLEALT